VVHYRTLLMAQGYHSWYAPDSAKHLTELP
jgi:hypothetical protein